MQNETKKKKKHKEIVQDQRVYSQNQDYQGRFFQDEEEVNIFPADGSMRIWLNREADGYSRHCHNAVEIILPIQNSYEVTLESSNQTFEVQQDEIFIIPSGEIHSLHPLSDGRRLIFIFDDTLLKMVRGYNGMRALVGKYLYLRPDEDSQIYQEIYDRLISMSNDYFNNSEFYEFSVYAHLFRILLLMTHYQLTRVQEETGHKNLVHAKYFRQFNSVLEYIGEHFTEELRLDDVADYCGFSKYHFSRLFKEYANTTFYDYLTQCRVKAAESFLEQEDMTITDIALQSGFSSISTFNRTFKLQKGCTPGEYRKLFHNR